jgi:preprotein translocase subunit SecA
MFGIVKKIFGTAQTRRLAKYRSTVQEINRYEMEYQLLSDEELKAKTFVLRKRLHEGATLRSILPEAYAVVKNTCRRLVGTEIDVSGYSQKWDMIPYDVQLMGGIAMFEGSIAEMQTGEGKTLTASLPLYLFALQGKGAHLVTTNDYLAERDCEWVGTIFRWLGLTTGALTNQTPLEQRQEIYSRDVIYGTASEFGFDYLRDNSMAMRAEEQVQREHFFAIVDEVDSILIDEARTPLIISGPAAQSNQMYDQLQNPAGQLVKKQEALADQMCAEVKAELEALGLLDKSLEPKKLTKAEEERKKKALTRLWIVLKGVPRHEFIKTVRENPDLRTSLEEIDTLFYDKQRQDERSRLLSELYITVDERASEYELTDKGIQTWSELTGVEKTSDFTMLDLGHEYALIDSDPNLSDEEKLSKKTSIQKTDALNKERHHNIKQLLRAHLLMECDVDYIIQEGKIVIIDENTGRPQPGRRFSEGLHQAIEAKEGVSIQEETQTYATITLQNYFRMYEHLAGMSGTAMPEAREFQQIYKLDVVAIPTYKPCKRNDAQDEVYMTKREKYHAILKEVQKIHSEGRPILLGTETVEVSETLSRIFTQNGLKHHVLNARFHDKEAEIIAAAGQKGAITIATNMAGRGTDIKLGQGVSELGGLCVIGSTRHQSRRIDRQLRGRCGRLGDPGSSKFYVSFEDDLMRLFASPKMTAILNRFRPPEGEPISASILTKSIETAQKRVEQRNFTIRKHTLEYDDVMNRQRQEFYAFRQEILSAKNLLTYIYTLLQDYSAELLDGSRDSSTWDATASAARLCDLFPISFSESELKEMSSAEEFEKKALRKLVHTFKNKVDQQKRKIDTHRETIQELIKAGLLSPEAQAPESDLILSQILKEIFTKVIDKLWQEHLLHIDHLRSEVHMRSVGQKDPLVEFKHDSFELFEEFIHKMRALIAQKMFSFEVHVPSPEEFKAQVISMHEHVGAESLPHLLGEQTSDE